MLALAHLEDSKWEAMAGHVLLRDGVPAAMLDGNPRIIAYRFEADVYVCSLVGGERALAPSEGQPLSRRPD